MYDSFMMQKIQYCESSKKIYTSSINQRNIMSNPNELHDLGLLLKYIKQNPKVNLPTNPIYRSDQYMLVPQYKEDKCLNSSLISINKENASKV